MNIYEKHILTNPALPFLFHIDHIRSQSSLQKGNWHENVEVLCFIEGEGRVRLNARSYNVGVGDIVVVNSNYLHEFSTDTRLRYHCLIIDRSFCENNYFDTNNIHFKTHFKDDSIYKKFEELRKYYEMPESTPWRTHSMRLLVLSLLTDLCKDHSESYDQNLDTDVHLLSCVKKAIGFICSESQREISLDEICELVGLSKYYFAREFKRITGHTIVHYINITRCESAKAMLCETSATIAQIAAHCGFSDQSYFTRVFKAMTGISPTEYRKENVIVK